MAIAVCKCKKESYSVKRVITLDRGCSIKNVPAYELEDNASGAVCAFEVRAQAETYLFAVKVVTEKNQWIKALETQLKAVGATITTSSCSSTTGEEWGERSAIGGSAGGSGGGASSGCVQQRWEWPRNAIAVGEKLPALGNGVLGSWFSGTIFGKSECMVRVFTEGAPPDAIEAEISVMKECRHTNILQLICTCSAAPGPTWMVTDLIVTTLKEFLSKKGKDMTPQFLANVSAQICLGVSVLHNKNYIHAAISDTNVLVDGSFECKVSGFDTVKRLPAGKHAVTDAIGCAHVNPRWAAPETLVSSLFSHASDVWNLAVLVHVVLSRGEQPWQHVSEGMMYATIKDGIRLPQSVYMSTTVYAMLLTAWHIAPSLRPSAKDMGAVLEKEVAAQSATASKQSIHLTPVVGVYQTYTPDVEPLGSYHTIAHDDASDIGDSTPHARADIASVGSPVHFDEHGDGGTSSAPQTAVHSGFQKVDYGSRFTRRSGVDDGDDGSSSEDEIYPDSGGGHFLLDNVAEGDALYHEPAVTNDGGDDDDDWDNETGAPRVRPTYDDNDIPTSPISPLYGALKSFQNTITTTPSLSNNGSNNRQTITHVQSTSENLYGLQQPLPLSQQQQHGPTSAAKTPSLGM